MKHTEINLVALFNEGCRQLYEDYKDVEVSKKGNLRAGDSGALLHDGSVVGQCHRKAFARWIGQPKVQPDPMKQSHFDHGYKNEDNWLEKIERSWEGHVFCEDNIPVEWFTSAGVRVTGRPDMVLCDYQGTPQLVIEHKAVVSVNQAAKRFLGDIDSSHFLQACHYSMELGVPSTVVYSFSGIGMVPFWIKKEDKEKFWPKGKSWEVKPFKKEFKIGKDPDTGYYYYLVDGKITVTEVIEKSVRQYYDLLVDMRDQKSLYKRHSNKDVTGSPMKYNNCDYCKLKSTCDQYEDDFDRWCDEVKKGGSDV